jgi:hypothetical protein
MIGVLSDADIANLRYQTHRRVAVCKMRICISVTLLESFKDITLFEVLGF